MEIKNDYNNANQFVCVYENLAAKSMSKRKAEHYSGHTMTVRKQKEKYADFDGEICWNVANYLPVCGMDKR